MEVWRSPVERALSKRMVLPLVRALPAPAAAVWRRPAVSLAWSSAHPPVLVLWRAEVEQ